MTFIGKFVWSCSSKSRTAHSGPNAFSRASFSASLNTMIVSNKGVPRGTFGHREHIYERGILERSQRELRGAQFLQQRQSGLRRR